MAGIDRDREALPHPEAHPATEPGRAMVVANVAFKPESGLMTPRQLGPMTRILAARASSRT